MKTKYLWLILAAMACQKSPEIKTETESAEDVIELSDQQLKSFEISEVAIVQQQIDESLKLNGKIDVPPQNLISVSSAMGGYVKSTKLLPGIHFKKGELIATMEDQQYIQLQQDYLSNKIKLQQAEQELQRQQSLNQSKASSDKNYLQAKTDFQSLQINQAALLQKLKLINIKAEKISLQNISSTANIYAPFDGFVSQVFINVGQYVNAATVMFELVNPRDIHLNLKVFEKDLSKLNIGQKLLAYTNNKPQQKYPAQVVLMSKNIAEDRSLDLHAHFNRYYPELIPGMYMNAEIMIPGPKTWALPQECIQLFEGQHYVFERLSKNKFKILPVKIGLQNQNLAEISNAKNLQNKAIVQKGAYTLLMALKNKAED